jgi:iron(II)-dependent oxidoreductase
MRRHSLDLKRFIVEELQRARKRTLDLLAPLSEVDLTKQHSPLMSPLVWDLGHIAHYEETWLVSALTGRPKTAPEHDYLFDAFRHPRSTRSALPLPAPCEARAFAKAVREQTLSVLDSVTFDDRDRPLLCDGFVYGMVIQHEHQHAETILATLQLMAPPGYQPRAPKARAARTDVSGEAFIESGPFTMGTSDEPWAYDNERPAHTIHLAPYFIDRAPVSNAQYLEFVEAGGYDQQRFWTDDGWLWRLASAAHCPMFWKRQGHSWFRHRFGFDEPLLAHEPVMHVSWFEADAYARWLGKRLPTEAEWERAARLEHDDDTDLSRIANLGAQHFGPAAIGAYPEGQAWSGCHQIFGDVWEWTASPFAPYPGFTAFPYREYSEVFFDGRYKVLRGGSWATDACAMRATFRNWDYPQRRQIFAGFRCARDA